MRILVLNTGSSSVKLSLIDAASNELLLGGQISWSVQSQEDGSPCPASLELASAERKHERKLSVQGPGEAVTVLMSALTEGEEGIRVDPREVAAIGHRVVHGGKSLVRSQRITPEVKAEIRRLCELAPLHNPSSLEGIEAAESAWPEAVQVAAFDTAFHATLPDEARIYPVPHSWTNSWDLRRYGFHGLSHAYCATRAAGLLGRGPENIRLVICHLGNGCSLSAVRDGVCIDTTMGFTPLEGLMMGSRSGSVDPGLLIYLLKTKGITAESLDQALNHESGLLGVSGVSADMRKVLEAARTGSQQARLAVAIFVHRLKHSIGGMAAILGGIDALVFTAGIGEHAAEIREASCRGLSCLGLELSKDANSGCQPDADIATSSSPARILVITSREDLTIVHDTVRVLKEG